VASLGNVGHNVPIARAETEAWNSFTFGKQPTSVDMALTGTNASVIPNSFLSLFRNGVLNARSRTDGSGNCHFYDMDDSGSQVYTIVAFTQDGPTGELWSATVVGATATVTKTADAIRSRGFVSSG
jgi:hypothetical protein